MVRSAHAERYSEAWRITSRLAVTWTDRVNEYITGASKVAGTSLAVEDWANQSVSADCLITNFEEACGDGCSSDSRSGSALGLQDALVCHLGDSVTLLALPCLQGLSTPKIVGTIGYLI